MSKSPEFKYFDIKDVPEELINDLAAWRNTKDHMHTAAEAYEAALNRKYGIYAGIDRGENPDETTIRLEIPKIDQSEIDMNIDRVLSSSEYMKQINDLILEDEKERYVRELLNRIHNALVVLEEGVKFCENDSQGVYDMCNMTIKREQKVIAILKGYSDGK